MYTFFGDAQTFVPCHWEDCYTFVANKNPIVMIKIFPVEVIKNLDNYTIENEPVAAIDLVERAATTFLYEFTRRFSKQYRIIIFAGQGNNGADALTIARLLIDESYNVEVYLFNPTDKLSQECEENKNRLLEIEQIEFTEVRTDFEPPILTSNDILIDGLFGSGLNRPLSGGFAAIVKYVNQSSARVVSIDIPSGLLGEDNMENDQDAIIKADFTFTFGFPKLSFLLADNAHYAGNWKTLDIGIHPDAIAQTDTQFFLIEETDIMEMIKPRDKFAHKGNFGHALLVAGSKGKMGAAHLAAHACMRSGAGLLTVHLPQCGEIMMQTAFPEAMVSSDQNSDHFSIVPELSNYSAIGLGPGLGQHLDSFLALERIIKTSNKPLLLDADAINMLATNKELIASLPKDTILTPHPKEFDRLDDSISTSSYERLIKAQKFAYTQKIYIILKGAHSSICTPEGIIYFNNSGNPGMATAGSGDVLTGIILGLLSQGYTAKEAALAGVYLHGLAGDFAAFQQSEESMIAGDITKMLGKAFKQLK